MSNTYFGLFKKAKKLVDEHKIHLEFYKETETGAVYIFKVKDEYTVSLNIARVDDSKTSLWKRSFQCDCRASIRTSNEMCYHILACMVYMVLIK